MLSKINLTEKQKKVIKKIAIGGSIVGATITGLILLDRSKIGEDIFISLIDKMVAHRSKINHEQLFWYTWSGNEQAEEIRVEIVKAIKNAIQSIDPEGELQMTDY